MERQEIKNEEINYPNKYQVHFINPIIIISTEFHIDENQKLIPVDVPTFTGQYPGTLSLGTNLKKTLLKTKNDIIRCTNDTGLIQSYKIKSKDKNELLKLIISEYINPKIETAKNNGETIILGFSVWANCDLLIMDMIIEHIKSKYPYFIFIAGGPSLTKYDEEYVNRLFERGIDYVNIGGGKEAVDWLASIKTQDIFVRKKNGDVSFVSQDINIPPNIIVKGEQYKGYQGVQLFPDMSYSKNDGTLDITFDTYCPNKCDFCSISTKNIRNFNFQESIEKINEAISLITQNKLDLYYIQFFDINPMRNVQKFDQLLSKINIPKQTKIICYGNAYGLRNSHEVIELLNLINKYPIDTLTISPDAIDEEGDGEIIGKKIGKRNITQTEYDNMWHGIKMLLTKLSETQKDIRIVINNVIHPWQGPNLYVKKLLIYMECCQIGEKTLFKSTNWFPLTPFYGANICEQYKGHFVPLDILVAFTNINPDLMPGKFSAWGHYFENTKYFDLFYLLTRLCNAQFILNIFKALNGEHISDNDSNIKFINKICIADKNNKLLITAISLLFEDELRYLNELKNNNSHEKEKGISRRLFNMNYLLDIIYYFVRRETYLFEKNPETYGKEENAKLIESLIKLYYKLQVISVKLGKLWKL